MAFPRDPRAGRRGGIFNGPRLGGPTPDPRASRAAGTPSVAHQHRMREADEKSLVASLLRHTTLIGPAAGDELRAAVYDGLRLA